MMKLVDAHAASSLAVERKHAWLQLAWGHATGLEDRLGPAIVDDYLPGLGMLPPWGVVDEDRGITGSIMTGYYPKPPGVRPRRTFHELYSVLLK